MFFKFWSWGVQRNPGSYPEVYLKLRDEKNREIISKFTILDVLNEKKDIRGLFWNLVFEAASQFVSCDDEWLKDAHVSNNNFEKLQHSMKKLISKEMDLGEFLKEWDGFEFKMF